MVFQTPCATCSRGLRAEGFSCEVGVVQRGLCRCAVPQKPRNHWLDGVQSLPAAMCLGAAPASLGRRSCATRAPLWVRFGVFWCLPQEECVRCGRTHCTTNHRLRCMSGSSGSSGSSRRYRFEVCSGARAAVFALARRGSQEGECDGSTGDDHDNDDDDGTNANDLHQGER